jgi:SAM-dependent methyltransferase
MSPGSRPLGRPDEWRSTNQTLWDERAAAHATSRFYDLDGVVDGRDHLRPWEDAEVGPVSGLDLIHLQCHIGTDTVAWARRGAKTVGLDFSSESLAVASELSRRCRLSIEWVCAEVYDAVSAVDHRSFDVVYTGIGALNWLPDLTPWAKVVGQLLRPGGILYLLEMHPMWVALKGGTTLGEHAINAPYTRWDVDEPGSYAAPDRIFDHVVTYERLHALSDVIGAVLDAGLVIELFHEFDTTPAPTPWLEPGPDRLYRFPPDAYRFPVLFSLRARRPADLRR